MTEPLGYRARRSAVFYIAPRAIDRKRTLMGLLVAIGAAAVGSVAYAKIEPELQALHWRALSAVIAAVAVGLIAMGVTSYGKVRSAFVAAVLGAVIGVVSLYVIWVVYLHDELNKIQVVTTYSELIAKPGFMYRAVRFFNMVGTWKLKNGDTIRGFPLTVLWAGEATMIFLCGVLFPIKAVVSAEEIDCSACGEACRLVRPILRFAFGVQDQLIAAVEGHEFARLMEFPQPHTDDEPQFSMRLIACPKCGETNVVTVNRLMFELTPKGRKLAIRPVVNRLLITREEAVVLKELMKQVAERHEAKKRGGEGEEVEGGEDGAERPDQHDAE